MTKFGIGLCILLVACSGAQSMNLDFIPNMVGAGMKLITDQAEEKIATLGTVLEKGLAIATSLLEDLSTNVANVVSQIDTKVAEYSTDGSPSALTCAETAVAAAEANTKAKVSEVKTCFEVTLADVQSQYDTLKLAIAAVIADSKAVQDILASCVGSWLWGWWTCLQSLWNFDRDDVVVDWNNLSSNATSLVQTIANLPKTLESCDAAGALTSVTTDAKDTLANIKECFTSSTTDSDVVD